MKRNYIDYQSSTDSTDADKSEVSDIDEAFELDLMAAKQPKKQVWSKQEDASLLKIVQKYGASNWDIIAKYVKHRTGKQCRERYHNILNPNVRKGNWTADEDKKILELHASLGNQWAKIARGLEGRTDNSVKNRFHALNRSKPEVKKIPDEINAFFSHCSGLMEMQLPISRDAVIQVVPVCEPL